MDIEQALDKYQEHFGMPYPLCVGFSLSEDEIISDIQNRIKNEDAAPPPEYQDGCDY